MKLLHDAEVWISGVYIQGFIPTKNISPFEFHFLLNFGGGRPEMVLSFRQQNHINTFLT